MKPMTVSGNRKVAAFDFDNNIKALMSSLSGLPENGITYKHHTGGGVYLREVNLKANALAVGAKHLKETMDFLSKGTIYIYTDEGRRKVEAPAVFVSPAGAQRAVLAITDAVFTTVHPLEGRTIEQIEMDWVGDNTQLLGGVNNIQLLKTRRVYEKLEHSSKEFLK
jgi:hypothetical protein